jgi:hypothetical protein
MYKLNIDLERKLEIMSKHELTAEEWLMIEMLFIAEDHPEILFKYFNECKKEQIPRDTLISLKDKKVFSTSFTIPLEGQSFDPTQVEFSKTFLNNYFKNSYEAGWELFDAYPEYCQSTNGASNQLYPARNITKSGYMDENDLFAKYNKAIQYKVENHNEVMELLEFAKSENLLQYGIVEYITTRKWLAHRELRDKGEINNMQLKVETMRSIN